MTAESTDPLPGRALAEAWARAYGKHDSAASARTEDGFPDRARADALAAWRRWHDSSLDEGWSEHEEPFFQALEQARVEQLASNHLPGMARNLAGAKSIAAASTCGRLYIAAREVFAGSDCPSETVLEQNYGWSLRRFFSSRPVLLSETALNGHLQRAAELLDKPRRFVECVAPVIDALARYQASLINNEPAVPGMLDAGPIVFDEEMDGDEKESERAKRTRVQTEQQTSELLRIYPEYRIYSAARDEEGPATRWLRLEDTDQLRLLLASDRQRIRRLAHQLQRRLQAAKLRQWEFDQEEGRLDNRRLARLVTDRTSRQVFRRECQTPVTEACVTFLVDLSGSMRGQRQQLAAMTVDLAVHTLETCGIDSEVLGFTTRYGFDNPLEQHWQQAGAFDTPGRLNAVRHIIFKTDRQRWQRARQGIGLMLREDFGRENVDGEALHWAARRLSMKQSPNRILLVLSDGQPFDHSTARANGAEFLENALRQVVDRIEGSPISLIAVGTAMDVTRFYRHALRVSEPHALAEELFENLGTLLTRPRDGSGRA